MACFARSAVIHQTNPIELIYGINIVSDQIKSFCYTENGDTIPDVPAVFLIHYVQQIIQDQATNQRLILISSEKWNTHNRDEVNIVAKKLTLNEHKFGNEI